jgi:hypothetical protein
MNREAGAVARMCSVQYDTARSSLLPASSHHALLDQAILSVQSIQNSELNKPQTGPQRATCPVNPASSDQCRNVISDPALVSDQCCSAVTSSFWKP